LFIVYLIHNVVNGKIYVGWTGQGFETRWNIHCNDAIRYRYTSRFARAIRKYGPKSFSYEILGCVNTKEIVTQLENLWILTLGSYHPEIGYNMTYGGEKGAVKGKYQPSMKGKYQPPHSLETKIKIGKFFRENNPMKDTLHKAKKVALQTGRHPNRRKHYKTIFRVCYCCFRSFSVLSDNKEKVFCSQSCFARRSNVLRSRRILR
jgi:group I intron endonuclease